MKKLIPLDSSFRDSAGFVYAYGDKILRSVTSFGKIHYQLYLASGLRELFEKNVYVIPFTEVTRPSIKGAWKMLRVERIPFITYPYEWTFEMFKDAAMLVLRIEQMSLNHGMSLKDASAYNVQFSDGKPVWIDLLSFEQYVEGNPWNAYGQYCRHFLAPLLLMAKTNAQLSRLGQLWIDGIPLDVASCLLPWSTRMNANIYIHIHLHASLVRTGTNNTKMLPNKKEIFTLQDRLNLIQSLLDTIEALDMHHDSSPWASYADHTSYTVNAEAEKKKIVETVVEKIKPSNVLDIGANSGTYSKIAAINSGFVVAIDNDMNALQDMSKSLKKSQINNILPLYVDLTNPTPSVGWKNTERLSFLARSTYDLVLVLAVIHHLVVGNNLSFRNVARMLSDMSTYVLVEFVPQTDEMVKKMMQSRERLFTQYSQEAFEAEFSEYFHLVNQFTLSESDRRLFLFKKKHI